MLGIWKALQSVFGRDSAADRAGPLDELTTLPQTCIL